MASIEKRVRGEQVSWLARYRDPSGKQRSKSFDRKVDATNFLTSVESSKLIGGYIDPKRSATTINQLADSWIAGKVDLKPTTLALYESVLAVHVRPRWGTTRLDRIEHGAVQAWIAGLVSSGTSGGHVRKITGVFTSVLALAVRERRLATNPATGVALPRGGHRERQYLTARQVEQLANSAGAGRLPVLVLAYCGLRWSEMAALRVSRVDLLRRRLSIAEGMTEVNGRIIWGTPKSHETRSVPIPASLIDELMVHMAGKAASDLVFTAPGGGPLRNRNARRAWFDRAAEDIGEPDLVPHGLRHTAASLAVSAGGNVLTVARMLGHADPSVTLKIYADLFDDDLDAVAGKLDEIRAAAVYPVCNTPVVAALPAARQNAAGE